MSFADKACEGAFRCHASRVRLSLWNGYNQLAPVKLQNGHMVMVHQLSNKIDLAGFPALVASPEDLAKPLCCG